MGASSTHTIADTSARSQSIAIDAAVVGTAGIQVDEEGIIHGTFDLAWNSNYR